MFKAHISTIIDWKRPYEATGDVKTKVHRPVNKKIIFEKLIGYVEAHPDAYLKEITKSLIVSHSVEAAAKPQVTRKKRARSIQRASPKQVEAYLEKNQRYSQRKARIYR